MVDNSQAVGKKAGAADPKPQAPAVIFRNIPDQLKALDQWVVWRFEFRNAKWTKPPFMARTGQAASTTNPKTWCSLPAAKAAYTGTPGAWDGVGLALLPKNETTIFDLDHCRNPTTGELTDWATEIVAELNSYPEVTPGQDGVRVVCGGLKPDHEKMSRRGLKDWRGARLGRSSATTAGNRTAARAGGT
jgi:primase-polymerase (primpol)-like protein